MSDHEPTDGGLGGASGDAADELIDDPDTAATLRALSATLGDPAVWSEPPAWMADAIVAAITAERSSGVITDDILTDTVPDDLGASHDPTSADDHGPADDTRRGVVVPMRPSRRRPTVWIASAAAAAVMAVAVGVVATRPDEAGDAGLAIAGTELAPRADATAEVTESPAGVAIQLDVRNLPPAPEGQFYAGWLRSDDGELVGIGSFHIRGGDDTVMLWSGVPIARYPTLTVTIQTEGEGVESSGEVVLRGSLTGG